MEIERTNLRSLEMSSPSVEEFPSGFVGAISDPKALEQVLSSRHGRREQFELQGDSYSTWVELGGESDRGESTGVSSKIAAKPAAASKVHFLRLDTAFPERFRPEGHTEKQASHVLVEIASGCGVAPSADRNGCEELFLAAPISRSLHPVSDVKNSLDTSNVSESNRIAAIRALELVEHQQELWLKKVKDYKLTTRRS